MNCPLLAVPDNTILIHTVMQLPACACPTINNRDIGRNTTACNNVTVGNTCTIGCAPTLVRIRSPANAVFTCTESGSFVQLGVNTSLFNPSGMVEGSEQVSV
jgi:hypothetical protein